MKHWLTSFNLAGVLAVAGLCGFQWRANHALNLELHSLERSRQELTAQVAEQEQTIRGCTSDLEDFRKQVVSARESVQKTEALTAAAGRTNQQLTLERDQLKGSVSEWAQAVTAREERAQVLTDQLQKLAEDRNEVVTKFNELVGKYKQMVGALNERTRQFNELAGRFEQARAQDQDQVQAQAQIQPQAQLQ
ncbi:MAG: hypothetical protein RL685_429 [Pseudomonadota bacterium]|jgi:chromosome segregation ATPase